MTLLREIVFLAFLVVISQTAGKEIRKKPTESVKVVENLSPSTPAARFEEKQGNSKGEVVVETIKSISPADYLTTTGSFEGSTPSKKVPFATVTYNAFEPETPKKLITIGSGITEISSPKKKSSYRHHTTGASSTQKLGTSTVQVSSTISPAPVRITSSEPDTTLLPNNQFTAQSSSVSQDISSTLGDSIITDRPLKIPIIKAKINNNNRYNLAKILKRPGKFDLKLSDSKPEETGFNGYHFDIGTLNVHSKPGMTGASYMRSSSPYYNFHVMLD